MSVQPFLFPMDYTSRDYLALRADLINVIQSRIPDWQANDPADFGVALVEAFAYMGDVVNYYVDRAAAETFLGTASQRQSILNLAGLLGYAPSGRLAAQVPLLFTNLSASSVQIPNGAQVRTVIKTGDVNIPLTFEVAANSSGYWTVPGNGASLVIQATEGSTVSATLGTSNGYPGQTFTIRDTPLINRSLSISVGNATSTTPYTYVQNLYEATANDKMYTYRTDEYGVTTVTFGDGVAGAIPPINQVVYATYRLGGGVIGNISQGQTFTPLNFTFTGNITNQVMATGGVDEESTEHIRQAAFTAFRTRNSAVTKQDFEDIAQSDNRIAKAKGRGNSFGNLLVYVAPISSGDPKTDPQPGYDAYNVVTSSLTSNVATLTLADTPQFQTNTPLTVQGMGAPWDGTPSRAVTFTAATSLVTINAHGFSNGDQVVFSTITTTTGITAGTTYYVIGATTNTFQVSATSGGTAITLTNDGTGTMSVTIHGNNITYDVTNANIGQTSTSGIVTTGELSDFASTRADIQKSLTAKGVIGSLVTVYPPRYLDIKLAIEIGIKPQFRQTDALAAVRTALSNMFNYNNVPFNLALRPQDVMAYLSNNVSEILFSTVTLYNNPGATSSTTLVQAASDQIIRLLANNLTLTVNASATGILA